MHSGTAEISILLVDIILSGVLAFCAIMLWSMVRDPAWMLIIIGVILQFGEVVFQTLHRFGIISVADMAIAGVPLFWLLVRGVPLLFVIAGFVVMIRSQRI